MDGFVLDGTPQDIQIQSGTEHELVYWNKRVGTLTVRKLDSVTGQPLPGVEFKIAYADGRTIGDSNGIYTTDSRGKINITGLNGTVVITETATIPGYVMDPDSRTQTVIVNPMRGKTATFTNAPMQTLTIHKYVTGTDNQPLPGVTFKVVDGTGKNVGNSDGIYVSDDSGDIVIQGLEQGTMIKVREIRTVDGYVLDGTPQDIEIGNSELHELTFWNAPKQTSPFGKCRLPVSGSQDFREVQTSRFGKSGPEGRSQPAPRRLRQCRRLSRTLRRLHPYHRRLSKPLPGFHPVQPPRPRLPRPARTRPAPYRPPASKPSA